MTSFGNVPVLCWLCVNALFVCCSVYMAFDDFPQGNSSSILPTGGVQSSLTSCISGKLDQLSIFETTTFNADSGMAPESTWIIPRSSREPAC